MKGNVVGDIDVGDDDIGDDGSVCRNAAEGGKLPFGDFANFQSRYPRASPRSGDRPRLLYWCSLETSLLRLHALKVDFRIQEGIIKGGG